MSIVIQNVSKVYSRKGEQEYLVKINQIPLSSFTHISEEGMATCLRKAADSLEEVDIDQKIKFHLAVTSRKYDI